MDIQYQEYVPDQNFDFSLEELSTHEQRGLYEYWLEIKGSSGLPSRKLFNPMTLPSALPYIVMMDVLENERKFKIRLIGSKTKVPSHFMGKYVNDFPQFWRNVEMLTQGVRYRKPYFYKNSGTVEDDIIRNYSSLVLPFSEDGERVNIMMACLCFLD